MILFDTCALLELLCPQPRLSKKVLDAMNEGVIFLSVTFAEIACKLETGKLEFDTSIPHLLSRIQNTAHFQIQDITTDMWLDAIDLHWEHQGKPHRDPVDRLILSYAIKNNLTLITSDQAMQRHYHNCIW